MYQRKIQASIFTLVSSQVSVVVILVRLSAQNLLKLLFISENIACRRGIWAFQESGQNSLEHIWSVGPIDVYSKYVVDWWCGSTGVECCQSVWQPRKAVYLKVLRSRIYGLLLILLFDMYNTQFYADIHLSKCNYIAVSLLHFTWSFLEFVMPANCWPMFTPSWI